jgi:hypothetical protein
VVENAVATRQGIDRRTVLLVASAAARVLAYVVGLVLPYYVNDLDRLPLREVASGGHDPKDLWPVGTSLEPLWAIARAFVVILGPWAVFLVLVLALIDLVGTWRVATRAKHTALLLVVAVHAALGGFVASPMGQALMRWSLD